jgi:hypothetical protein
MPWLAGWAACCQTPIARIAVDGLLSFAWPSRATPPSLTVCVCVVCLHACMHASCVCVCVCVCACCQHTHITAPLPSGGWEGLLSPPRPLAAVLACSFCFQRACVDLHASGTLWHAKIGWQWRVVRVRFLFFCFGRSYVTACSCRDAHLPSGEVEGLL